VDGPAFAGAGPSGYNEKSVSSNGWSKFFISIWKVVAPVSATTIVLVPDLK
jgi:hypothetical protein